MFDVQSRNRFQMFLQADQDGGAGVLNPDT